MRNADPHPLSQPEPDPLRCGFAGLIFAMGSVAIFLAAFALALQPVHPRLSRPPIEIIRI
jgi:hypothetical protein